MFRNVCNIWIRCQSFIVRPNPHCYFIIKYRICQRKHQFLIENRIWIRLAFCWKYTSVYSSWNEWIPWALLTYCDIFSLADNYRHLIVFRNQSRLINHCYSLSSFKTFYLLNPLFFIFFIILFFILNIIIFWRMSRGFLSRTNDKARNLKIPLNLIRIIGMKTANPSLIKLMIQSSVQSGQANAILADKLIQKELVVIVQFNNHFKCFQLVIIHENLTEGQRLCPQSRILLIFFLSLLNLICHFYF